MAEIRWRDYIVSDPAVSGGSRYSRGRAFRSNSFSNCLLRDGAERHCRTIIQSCVDGSICYGEARDLLFSLDLGPNLGLK